MTIPICRITEEEEYKLRVLYENANKTNANEFWKAISDYMDELGEKYHFEAKSVSIDTRGNVNLLPGTTCFVVMHWDFKTDEGPKPIKVFYNKGMLGDWLLKQNPEETYTYVEVSIE